MKICPPLSKAISLQQGFSLVEVVLALGLATFCLVAILTLVPVGLQNNRSSIQEIHAANLINLVSADIYNTIRNSASGTIAISSTSRYLGILLDGTNSTTLYFDNENTIPLTNQNVAVYSMDIHPYNSLVNSGSVPLTVTTLNIKISWPALHTTGTGQNNSHLETALSFIQPR